MADGVMTAKEAADALKVKVTLLRDWRYRGRGPKFLRLGGGNGGAIRYRERDIESFLNECTVLPGGEAAQQQLAAQ